MTEPDRRERKRLALRQAISDVATGLFFERGFDQVSVDEVALAADVGRMTVFNHFPRKEDLLFDRDEAMRAIVLEAVRGRDRAVSPVEALRRLAHRLATESHPVLRFFAGTRRFVEVVAASAALSARARAIRDELAGGLAAAMAESVGRPAEDAEAALAAGMVLASWTVAFQHGHAAFRREGNEAAARAVFLELVDQGARGVAAAVADTPYARAAG